MNKYLNKFYLFVYIFLFLEIFFIPSVKEKLKYDMQRIFHFLEIVYFDGHKRYYTIVWHVFACFIIKKNRFLKLFF